jgi:hypothetical protein
VRLRFVTALALLLACLPADLLAHGVAAGDKGFIQQSSGILLIPFAYLGAKHMVTGYDHLLFLFGVIFFLYRLKDVALYVTLFAIGHSTTLLLGVLADVRVNAYLIDAVIGLSVPWFRTDPRHGEYYTLILYGALGAVLLAGATDLKEFVVAMILQVTGIWNDFLFGVVYTKPELYPMTVQQY